MEYAIFLFLVQYLHQFLLHLRYTREAYGLILDITFTVNYEISRYTFYAHGIAQISPLLVSYTEMFTMNVRNHVFPSTLRRCFTGYV